MYALPDLNRTGRAWVYGLTERESITYDGMNGSVVWPARARQLLALLPPSNPNTPSGTFFGLVGLFSWLATRCWFLSEGGTVEVDLGLFNPGCPGRRRRLPTDIGSRIGIFYHAREGVEGHAQIFLVLNGLLLGKARFVAQNLS